jgi:hypothetical protein
MPDQWTAAYYLIQFGAHAGQILAAIAVAGAVWAGCTWARRAGRTRAEATAAAQAATPIEVEIGSDEDWDRLHGIARQEETT